MPATCGRFIGFTTGGENSHMVHRVLEGTRFAISVNFHPSFRHSEVLERTRVLVMRFLVYFAAVGSFALVFLARPSLWSRLGGSGL